jgi:hypothetical protein
MEPCHAISSGRSYAYNPTPCQRCITWLWDLLFVAVLCEVALMALSAGASCLASFAPQAFSASKWPLLAQYSAQSDLWALLQEVFQPPPSPCAQLWDVPDDVTQTPALARVV